MFLWTQRHRRIEYHYPKGNITLCKAKNITHKKQKRESFTELYFRITLSSVFIAGFAFVSQTPRAIPIPLLKFSDKNITHCAKEAFLLSEKPMCFFLNRRRKDSPILIPHINMRDVAFLPSVCYPISEAGAASNSNKDGTL